MFHLRDDFFCMSKETDKFLIGLTFLGHRIICSNFHIRQITKQFILCFKTDFSRINLWSFSITLIWFQLFIAFLKFFCPMITKLLRITVPVDYLIRIMEIKILLLSEICSDAVAILKAGRLMSNPFPTAMPPPILKSNQNFYSFYGKTAPSVSACILCSILKSMNTAGP